MAAAPVLQSERLKLKLKEGGGERRKGKEWLPGRQLLLNGCLYSLEEGAVNSLTAEAAESYTKLFLSFASNSLSFLVRTDFKTGALKLLSLFEHCSSWLQFTSAQLKSVSSRKSTSALYHQLRALELYNGSKCQLGNGSGGSNRRSKVHFSLNNCQLLKFKVTREAVCAMDAQFFIYRGWMQLLFAETPIYRFFCAAAKIWRAEVAQHSTADAPSSAESSSCHCKM